MSGTGKIIAASVLSGIGVWIFAQARRSGQLAGPKEISRWEGEGGNVDADDLGQNGSGTTAVASVPGSSDAGQWRFPTS